jgi:hypothetical protein
MGYIFDVTFYRPKREFRRIILLKRKQIMGILGSICAILGGVAWFFHQFLPGLALWGLAGLILLKLRKKKRT